MTDLTQIRREYLQGGLRRTDLTAEPMALFEQWFAQAVAAKLQDPTAMTVATVDADGQPWQRIVLLKQYDAQGLVFFTNLGSRKAQHLQHNSQISLHFPWHMLERQVAFTGRVTPLSATEVVKYFLSRPKESQLAAWASKQSSRLSARQVLESKFAELKHKFADKTVPLPSFWGGYRVKVNTAEFWQGGEHRLHDRFIYQRQDDSDDWHISRLAP
ncbi:pyridoxine/pyridoxamine 5'-phosphate oxidase [Shewanella sp. NFH-SH190041]|uniref:pyridoxamine 5'-phosphate oxidase n=1 Tax=Shewanella sp. NFH-SH190041 TaxID=2950245 RepID=UPI0021C3C82A|nr:pyridoxamine 5'-phosphate oxidase [Shewanella sp. NFH-SH190041]BDM64523.1 pyridoxine/pyridoxamine 5'-phosphate oxidase [Shewanella sp. NFH-SH190041]